MKKDESNRKLQRGDLLATTCIFNTEGVKGPTRGGFGTFDEMCINFVMFYPAQAMPYKSCINDQTDRGAPFNGVWPAQLSQTKSPVLELPELAEALLTASIKEYGPWGYPTNNFTVVEQLKQMPNLAEGLPTSEDILIDGPAMEEDLIEQPIASDEAIAVVVAAGTEGESDPSSAFAQSRVRLITIALCSAVLFLLWSSA